ncbi:MAG: MGMT family protein [Myxococcota bacterium]
MTSDLNGFLRQLRDSDLGWRKQVYAVVDRIPAGHVLGYKDVAALLGRPRNARQVGFALAALVPGHQTPWWRVIRSDGTIAMQGDPYRGSEQIALLTAEGVTISDSGRINMKSFRWDPWR